MVEGPGCKLKGEKIKSKLLKQTVTGVRGNAVQKEKKPKQGDLTSKFDVLIGRTLDNVQTLGKELFMFFGDLCLRVHFLMAGSFRVNDQQLDRDYGKITETPSLQINFSTDVLKFYKSAVDVRSSESCSSRYQDLHDLDICSPVFNQQKAVAMVMNQTGRQICDVLLDQVILPGVGNIIKNEALFDSGVKPSSKVDELSPSLVSHLVKMTRDFSMIFYKCRKEGTNLNKFMKIYNKHKCGQCQGKVTITRIGDDSGRVTYYCAACQTNTIKSRSQVHPSKNSLLGWVQSAHDVQGEWTCTLCTLINKGTQLTCSACLAERSENVTSNSLSQVTVKRKNASTPTKNPKRFKNSHPSSNVLFEQKKQPNPPSSTNSSTKLNSHSNSQSQAPYNKSIKTEAPSKIPNCSTHNKPCSMVQARKKGDNYLCWFFSCGIYPRSKKCNFFQWADEQFPICPNHGKPAAFRTVMKEGPNNGRKFFACPLPKQKQCGFFEWAIGY